jgi:hypothetical protein
MSKRYRTRAGLRICDDLDFDFRAHWKQEAAQRKGLPTLLHRHGVEQWGRERDPFGEIHGLARIGQCGLGRGDEGLCECALGGTTSLGEC